MTWYEQSFGEDYLIVYKHRDMEAAAREVAAMSEWLHLSKGASVLDLCCGMGRHSVTLAELGYRVTGIDLSETLLTHARKYDAHQSIQWIRADMRELPFANQSFTAVVNFFTSFGYFTDDVENQRVLQEIDRVLAPGGKFLIDFFNAYVVRNNLQAQSERITNGLLIRESRRIEDGCVKKTIRIESTDSSVRNYEECVKLYGLHDFQTMLNKTDLVIDRVYGTSDGQPFDIEHSPRLILVGTKHSLEGSAQ